MDGESRTPTPQLLLETIFERALEGLFALDIPLELRITETKPRDSCMLCCERTLDGRVRHRPGRSGPEQRTAAMLRRLGLHVHTLAVVGGHETDVVLPTAPRPVVVEYDGSYWHADNENLESRQRRAWEWFGYRVVRLRESPLQSTGEWDLLLPAAYRSFELQHVGAAIALHVLEAGGIASMSEPDGERVGPASPQGWWVATEVEDDVEKREIGRWRTWSSANFEVVRTLLGSDRAWDENETLGTLSFVADSEPQR